MLSNNNATSNEHKRKQAIELIAKLIQRHYENKFNEQNQNK